MKKAVKWIAISTLSLILVVLIALAVVPLLLPLESMLADLLEEQTGRPAKVESVTLTLLGGAELEVKGVEVGELAPYGDRPMVKLNRLYAQFSVLPLLDSTVALGRVEVDGLELSIVSSKQGKLNIEELPAAQKIQSIGKTRGLPDIPDQDVAKAAKPHFIMGQFDMTGSVIRFHNLATGQHGDLPINQAAMRSDIQGKDTNIDIKIKTPGLEFMVRTNQGRSDGPTEIRARLDLAELGKRAAIVLPGLQCRGNAKLKVQVLGTPENPEVNGSCFIDKLSIHVPQTGVAPLDLHDASMEFVATGDTKAETINLRSFRAWSHSAGYDLQADCVLSPGKARGKMVQKVHLARMSQTFAAFLPKGIKLSGMATKNVDLSGDAESITLQGQSRVDDLMVHMPNAAAPFVDKHAIIDFNFKLDGKENVAIEEVAIQSRAAQLVLKGTAALGKTVQVKLNVSGPLLDADYLMLLIPGNGRPSGAKQQSKQAINKKEQAADLRRALNEVDLELNLDIGKIVYSGLELEQFKAMAKAGQGKASLENLVCGLFGGSMGAKADLDASPKEPLSRVSLDIGNMTVTPERFRRLQKASQIFSMPVRIVKGVFHIKASVQAKGLTQDEIKKTASGKGEIKIHDGVEVAFDALERMQGGQFIAPLVRGNIPEFYTRLNGSYTLGGGKLDYDLKFLESREKVDVQIKGLTTLTDGKVDARLMLSGEGIGRDLKRFLGPDGTFPIEIKGTVQRPVAVLRISGSLLQGVFGK